ncbi:hypothetical protein [Pedobacter borealis]|uniref:hypothetical protein n=1 Tax=Pedobacter borealis TaxID=475254 RepID=UPI00049365A5|nr:hypothetical protein [Pedobacter borealis]
MKYIYNLIGNDWIKENISMIVLVPTLLGGIWQIIELSRIGTPYIRFFSVSQLVSDGLLLLFIFAWTYLVWNFLPKIEKNQSAPANAEVSTENGDYAPEVSAIPTSNGLFKKVPDRGYFKKRDGYILAVFLAICLMIIYVWAWLPEVLTPFLAKEKLSIMMIVSIFTGVAISWAGLTAIFGVLLEINNVELNRDNKWVKWLTIYLYIFGFFGGLFFLFHFLTLFHRSYLLPDNLKNLRYIECKVRANNKSLKSYGIEYFNDKYIFVAIYDIKNKQSIEVFKFEDFLDSSACDQK